jgi:hypothetical protein
MYIHVRRDQVRVLAPVLLAGYRSPFTGASGADNPVISAGFMITNSETGCGAFRITPRLVAQVSDNSMTITRQSVKAVHLGERLDEGIQWSAETSDKLLALLTSKTRDAVRSFLDRAWVERAVRALETEAGHPVAEPEEAIRVISTELRFTEAQQKDILRHFFLGTDLTAGGVMHAITSVAQTIDDPDVAHDIEAAALRGLHLAATL